MMGRPCKRDESFKGRTLSLGQCGSIGGEDRHGETGENKHKQCHELKEKNSKMEWVVNAKCKREVKSIKSKGLLNFFFYYYYCYVRGAVEHDKKK